MNERARVPIWRRWPLWLALVLVIATAGFVLRAKEPKAPEFSTAIVERGDLEAKVTASGTLSALVTVDVGSQVSGRIQSLSADYNSQVTKGQRIAKIDPANFDAVVAQARANVTAAEANVVRLQVQAEDAQRQARRADELADQKLIAQGERDTVRANARAAEAGVLQGKGQLAQARAALTSAETNLRYTDIISPTDGIVISRSVNVGQTVAASLSAPVLFTIAQDLRQMEVHTNVAEADIGKLAEGMEASFTVDAFPGMAFRGKLRTIRNAPQILQNVVTYDAVIEVANPDLLLKPGMTAYVSVVHTRRENALLVPNAALRYRPPPELLGAMKKTGRAKEGAGTPERRPKQAQTPTPHQGTIWVLRDGALQAVQVQTGASDGSLTEIVDAPLREGEEIVTGASGTAEGERPSGSRRRYGGMF